MINERNTYFMETSTMQRELRRMVRSLSLASKADILY